MKILPDTPVGEIAVEMESAIELFEKRNINYFFGGHYSLEAACAQVGADMTEILGMLLKLQESEPMERGLGWKDKPLCEIIDHIVKRQHVFIRMNLAILRKKASDLTNLGKFWDPLFPPLNHMIQEMAERMEEHMNEEESAIFPYIKAMEQVWAKGNGPSGPCSGPQTARQIFTALRWNHEVMWGKWIFLRNFTSQFRPAGNENPDFEILCRRLEQFEEYIHQHGHLEDNILFRKAKDMGILA